ncbi:MAG: 50S ribosomal protein L29 [Candidatus Dormibacteraceae bacterium]
MQVQELRELDAEELSGRLKGARRELFELRFKLAVGQLDNPHQIKTVRREIARMLTIVHERLLDEEVDEAYAGAEPVATLPVAEVTAETTEEAEAATPVEATAEAEVDDDTPEEVEAPATEDAEVEGAEGDQAEADEAEAEADEADEDGEDVPEVEGAEAQVEADSDAEEKDRAEPGERQRAVADESIVSPRGELGGAPPSVGAPPRVGDAKDGEAE